MGEESTGLNMWAEKGDWIGMASWEHFFEGSEYELHCELPSVSPGKPVEWLGGGGPDRLVGTETRGTRPVRKFLYWYPIGGMSKILHNYSDCRSREMERDSRRTIKGEISGTLVKMEYENQKGQHPEELERWNSDKIPGLQVCVPGIMIGGHRRMENVAGIK